MNVFFQQLEWELRPDVQAVLTLDQAGVHTAKKFQVYSEATLFELPPYILEPNRTKNIWHYLRRHNWSNRDIDNHNALCGAANHAWREAVLPPEVIKTVCNAP